MAASVDAVSVDAVGLGDVKVRLDQPSLGQPLLFQSYQQGSNEKDYLLPFPELQKRAQVSDTSAMVLVALSLRFGWFGCVVNVEESNKLIALAKRDEKSPAGNFAQGLCCEYGIGGVVIKNYDKAKELYTLVGKTYLPARYYLAFCLYKEEYANTSTVTKTSTSEGTATVEDWGNMEDHDVDVSITKVTTTTIQHVNAGRRETMRKLAVECAEQGFIPALSLLANCYRNGYGVTQDPREAMKLGKIAAEQGDMWCRRLMGQMYYGPGPRERVVEKSWDESQRWYKLAAEQGDQYSKDAVLNCPCCTIL